MVGIDIEHCVSTDKADIATSGPCARARIVKGPSLTEYSARWQLGTIRDSVSNKVGIEVSRGVFLDGRRPDADGLHDRS